MSVTFVANTDDWLVGGAAGDGGYNQAWGGDGLDTASHAVKTGAVVASLAGA